MLGRVLREHRALLLIVAIHTVVATIALELLGGPRRVSVTIYDSVVPSLLLIYVAAFFFGYFWWIVLRVRPRQLRPFLRDHLVARYLAWPRLLAGLVVAIAVTVDLSVYTSVKSVMPQIVPFGWDEAFMRTDLVVHGGRHPWEWLQPVLGTPAVTAFIDATYHSWFFVMYMGLFWQAFSRRDPLLRQQYLLTFVLVWAVIGNVAATLLSSAGPCYYGAVTGQPDPYALLMQYLQAVQDDGHPLLALEVQQELWQRYLSDGVGIGSGISAMPSVHNAKAWLLVFVCWRTHRALGILLAIYAVLIFIGSVHLGWHYAVDAYVAIAMTVIIWKLVGRVLRNSRVDGSAVPDRGEPAGLA